ncbi:ATP-binding protein [Streptomyces sp. RB6PN25]|uniref:ATP-binding protein n=1 Tax=Streptomyces humicola TaxID=2953240 RepID=A0ABT1PRQ9_9ACTN|nr:ATP-binding protein [Streptomyces humicola]MCQ4080356.1 ATP-binding protein [Streptomyces humicola]
MPPTDCSLVFPPDPLWVRSAREAVRTLLTAVRADELADTAALLTSEAVTNAVNACRTSGCSAPLTVYAKYSGALRVLVHDEAPGRPTRVAPTGDAETGRGVALIDACAAEWGVCRYDPGPGKTVWFELT